MDRFQDEDQPSDSEIKENWDDESEEEPEVAPVVIPKKKTTAQKIKEREEKERLQREEKIRERELRNKKLTPEELLAERLERQKMQEESDLKLAMETFGAGKSTNINLDEFTLTTKEDFEKFRNNLVSKLAAVSSEPFYASFLEDLFRELCVPIDTDDLKKISSSLTALYNEKLKAQRSANSKKKKGKGTSIKMEKNANMLAQGYDDDEPYNDDLDDFM